MLDDLIKTKPSKYKSFQTVGFIYSGLSSTTLNIVDRPTHNITRMIRQDPIVISHFIEHFGETVLTAKYSFCLDCNRYSQKCLLNAPPPTDEKEGGFSWMRGYFKKQRVSSKRISFSSLNNHA